MRIQRFLPVLLLLTFFVTSSRAQVTLTNTGVLYLSGTTDTLFINGSFQNTSTAALSNYGNLHIKEDITNDQALVIAATGKLVLSGASLQTLDGSEPFNTFHLVTNNPAGFLLNNDLHVYGSHTYTSGLIATSLAPNYLVYESGATHSGSSDAAHVTGLVRKVGAENFVFPVGNNSYLRSVAISSLSATSDFVAGYFTPTPQVFNLQSPVVQVKANEYWHLDQISGGTAVVTLNWNHAKVPMDNVLVPDILVSRFNGVNWIDAGGSGTATGTVTTTGSVGSAALSTFGDLTFGYKTFPVPLRLISFTADRRSGSSYLQWITENEQNTSHFEIQRSYDAITFNTIGTLAAANTGMRHQYAFEDATPLKGMAWYRIRMIDKDGRFTYSRISVVAETDVAGQSFVVLNPIRDVLTIVNKTGTNGPVDYHLYTLGGQLLLQGTRAISNNAASVISLPGTISSGVYLLEMTNGRQSVRQKILVSR